VAISRAAKAGARAASQAAKAGTSPVANPESKVEPNWARVVTSPTANQEANPDSTCHRPALEAETATVISDGRPATQIRLINSSVERLAYPRIRRGGR
jgi:hypothetical protein